jgi:hypothetical protein
VPTEYTTIDLAFDAELDEDGSPERWCAVLISGATKFLKLPINGSIGIFMRLAEQIVERVSPIG